MELKEAIQELRKNEKRNFEQTIDLIINLKDIDAKKDNVSTVINLPHKIKDKKVCAFLSKKSDVVKTITNLDFSKYREEKDLRKLVKEFDFFIAQAKLMPAVATNFGKVLGPSGKMPSPQLGIIMQEDDNTVKDVLRKIETAIKIKLKESSVKIAVGRENMDNEKIISNIDAVYRGLVNVLPTKKDNIKSVMIKLTMSKPVKVEMK